MKTDRVEGATLLDCHNPVCGLEVMLRFTNPLPEYLDNLRRHVHRGFCLPARLASTQCSPRSGNVRSGNWSKQRCPWGEESPLATRKVPPHAGLDRQPLKTTPTGRCRCPQPRRRGRESRKG